MAMSKRTVHCQDFASGAPPAQLSVISGTNAGVGTDAASYPLAGVVVEFSVTGYAASSTSGARFEVPWGGKTASEGSTGLVDPTRTFSTRHSRKGWYPRIGDRHSDWPSKITERDFRRMGGGWEGVDVRNEEGEGDIVMSTFPESE